MKLKPKWSSELINSPYIRGYGLYIGVSFISFIYLPEVSSNQSRSPASWVWKIDKFDTYTFCILTSIRLRGDSCGDALEGVSAGNMDLPNNSMRFNLMLSPPFGRQSRNFKSC